jgi:hypothetical protein
MMALGANGAGGTIWRLRSKKRRMEKAVAIHAASILLYNSYIVTYAIETQTQRRERRGLA